MNAAPPPWGPGQGEKQFAAFLDEHLATQIARASKFPIIDRITSDLERTAPPERPRGPFAWPRSALMALKEPPITLKPLAED